MLNMCQILHLQQGNAQEHEGTLQPSGGVNSDEDCNNHVMEMNGMPNDDPTYSESFVLYLNFASIRCFPLYPFRC